MHYSLKPAVLVDRRIGILKNPNWFFFIVTILIHLTGLLWGSHEIIWKYFLKLWTVIAAVLLFLNNTSSLIAFHHSMSPSHNSKELKTRQFFVLFFRRTQHSGDPTLSGQVPGDCDFTSMGFTFPIYMRNIKPITSHY